MNYRVTFLGKRIGTKQRKQRHSVPVKAESEKAASAHIFASFEQIEKMQVFQIQD